MNKTRYAMIVLVAMASIGAYAVLATATPAYAGGDYHDKDKCELPNGNDFPGNTPHEDNCPPGLEKKQD
jgi:hypothetical protein